MKQPLPGAGPASSRGARTPASGQRVQIADRQVPLALVRRSPARYTYLFAKARSEDGCAYCMCQGSQPRMPRLVIRARAGRFHLAGWPDEGSQHAHHCDFFKLDGELSGRPMRGDGGILQTEDGTSIRLNVPLTVVTAGQVTASLDSPDSPEAAAARRAIGLLGMVHFLWEEAQLNQWRNARRTQRHWHVCRTRLQGPLEECSVNGQPLAEALYVVPVFRRTTADIHKAAFAQFQERLGEQEGRARRGLLLGEIKNIQPSTYGHRIALRHLPKGLFASAKQLERWKRSYAAAFSSAAGETACRIALLAVEQRPRSGVLKVVDAAFMLTDRNYIPVDSSYELRMAEALADASRRFIKPLRWDRSDDVFPDFILTDTEPPTFVEVYGVQGRASYEIRKRIKQIIYQRQGRTVIAWEVAQEMPSVSLHK
ncbi:DUF1173 family protein [Streptomyces chartreusis]|uniref:DUF1173 family protein n=1 Tax=Streptomyces chartreusis TaxID=1969 RepID=UPI003868D332|nr:DUF1173 domain-containing protein [Streptomyces chartreusis]